MMYADEKIADHLMDAQKALEVALTELHTGLGIAVQVEHSDATPIRGFVSVIDGLIEEIGDLMEPAHGQAHEGNEPTA